MDLKLYWISPYSEVMRFSAPNSKSEDLIFKFKVRDVFGDVVCYDTRAMIFRVFSESLDPKKKWYALNNGICGITPKKFCNNEIFNRFEGEIASRPITELQDQHGGPISAKLHNAGYKIYGNDLFVGTLFSVVAGNLRRRNPCESQFLTSKEFSLVRDTINQLNICEIEESPPPSPSPDKNINISFISRSSSLERSFEELKNDDGDGNSFSIGKRKIPPKCTPPFCSSPINPSVSLTSDETSSSSSISLQEIENFDYETKYKKRKIRSKCSRVIGEIHDICRKHNEELSTIMARCCLFDRGDLPAQSKKIIQDVFIEVEEHLGIEKTFEELIPNCILQKKVKDMTVPDWQLLLLKLEVPISDDGWQTVLNRTQLVKGGSSSKAPILLLKNSMKALKNLVFSKVEGLFDIRRIEDDSIPGYEVGLEPVICWQIRELHLHGQAKTQNVQMNLKLDGRPFGGRNQVLVGVIPANTSKWSNHSCKSFHPLAIANCKEKRESLKKLISNLNREKDAIKRNGVRIDGQVYNVAFKVTLDLKALYLLLVKDGDDNFELGGKGLNVEFCFFCQAIRSCNCDLGPNSVCLEHFSKVKANIGSFKGLRDDLHFLMEEELSSINLCALHCELRNTEQLIGSLGLYAYNIGTLKECNQVLTEYGPETTGERIKVKMNIKVKSFSGNTERNILDNVEEIIRESLPHEALRSQFLNPKVAKEAILNKISFCSQQVKYYNKLIRKKVFIRDFGKYQEEVELSGQEVLKKMEEYLKIWEDKLQELRNKLSKFQLLLAMENVKQTNKSKRELNPKFEALSDYASQITYEFFLKVFIGWRDIAKVIRTSVFGQDEQHKIDLYDLQCKEWGFLLRETFGPLLGTGDYGHMTIEHTSMLFRVFGSLREYSNQSIEAAHSMQRQIYSKATSHDRHGYTSSIRQMMLHFYSERILFLRLCFRKALECSAEDKPFHFQGCGWPISTGKEIHWSTSEKEWMQEMDSLMTRILGNDFLLYECNKITKVMEITSTSFPDFVYSHKQWEDNIAAHQKPPDNLNSSSSQKEEHVPHVVPPTVPESFASDQQNHGSVTTENSTQRVSTGSNSASPSFLSELSKTKTRNPTPLLYPDLKKCCNSNLTRRQLSSMQLPPVVMLSELDLEVVNNASRFSNPLLIAVRPPASIVKKCMEMLQRFPRSVVTLDDDNEEEDEEDGIQVGGLGVYNRHALNIWESAAQANDIKHEVTQELRWLSDSDGILTKENCSAIEKILLDSKPCDQVLAIGDTIVDIRDLSTLVGERYLTGFLIDIACLKYKEKSQNGGHTLYLPTFFQEWASAGNDDYLKEKILKYTQPENILQVSWILTPQLLGGSHWGLLCINLRTNEIFYDDGLHWNPPSGIVDSIKRLLQILHQISGYQGQFDQKRWNFALPIQRFGMPTQPPGSGSCGMGVIMSVNCIMNGPLMEIPVFDWKFEEMFKYRRMLMKTFIEWKNN